MSQGHGSDAHVRISHHAMTTTTLQGLSESLACVGHPIMVEIQSKTQSADKLSVDGSGCHTGLGRSSGSGNTRTWREGRAHSWPQLEVMARDKMALRSPNRAKASPASVSNLDCQKLCSHRNSQKLE